MKVVIAGGGAAGCSAALPLARAGHEVLVLERDRLEPRPDVEDAAAAAFRTTAPQIVHPHLRGRGSAPSVEQPNRGQLLAALSGEGSSRW